MDHKRQKTASMISIGCKKVAGALLISLLFLFLWLPYPAFGTICNNACDTHDNCNGVPCRYCDTVCMDCCDTLYTDCLSPCNRDNANEQCRNYADTDCNSVSEIQGPYRYALLILYIVVFVMVSARILFRKRKQKITARAEII